MIADMIVGQVTAELDQMRDLYTERAPKTVLEIGVYYGGTLREWLGHAAPNATVVAVDPNHLNPDLYDDWKHDDTTLIVGNGRTSELTDLIHEHAPYDWVFVDGDHQEAGVRFDIEFMMPLIGPGGLLLLHDIVAEGYPPLPPRVCFDELAATHLTWEIVATPDLAYPANCGHGIGVVQL